MFYWFMVYGLLKPFIHGKSTNSFGGSKLITFCYYAPYILITFF